MVIYYFKNILVMECFSRDWEIIFLRNWIRENGKENK